MFARLLTVAFLIFKISVCRLYAFIDDKALFLFETESPGLIYNEPTVQADSISNESEDVVFYAFEKKPEFPGGVAAMQKFIADNLIYPEKAKKNNIEGKVVIEFIIEKDGSVSNVSIIEDIGGGCGMAAKRMVESMPKWKPASLVNQPIRFSIKLPIQFKVTE